MKTIQSLRLLALPFAAALALSCGHAQNGRDSAFAVLYAEPNFQGWSYRVLPGDEIPQFDRLDDGRWAFLDRTISSIEVRGAIALQAWDRDRFRGNALEIASDQPDLRRLDPSEEREGASEDWNDRIQSLKAHRPFARGNDEYPANRPPRSDWNDGERPSHPPAPPPTRAHRRGPPSGDIALFADENLGGEALFFDRSALIPDLGEYLRGDRDWNDCLTSLSIVGPYQVTLYEHAGFRGRSISLASSALSAARLINSEGNYENWNDRVSSLKIERVRGRPQPESAPTPIGALFWDSSYRGESLPLHDGLEIRNLGDFNWNDKASSLKLEPGYIAELYAGADFRGPLARLASNQPDLGRARNEQGGSERFNDRVSSLRIRRL